jgi:hypothetical protein
MGAGQKWAGPVPSADSGRPARRRRGCRVRQPTPTHATPTPPTPARAGRPVTRRRPAPARPAAAPLRPAPCLAPRRADFPAIRGAPAPASGTHLPPAPPYPPARVRPNRLSLRRRAWRSASASRTPGLLLRQGAVDHAQELALEAGEGVRHRVRLFGVRAPFCSAFRASCSSLISFSRPARFLSMELDAESSSASFTFVLCGHFESIHLRCKGSPYWVGCFLPPLSILSCARVSANCFLPEEISC